MQALSLMLLPSRKTILQWKQLILCYQYAVKTCTIQSCEAQTYRLFHTHIHTYKLTVFAPFSAESILLPFFQTVPRKHYPSRITVHVAVQI